MATGRLQFPPAAPQPAPNVTLIRNLNPQARWQSACLRLRETVPPFRQNDGCLGPQGPFGRLGFSFMEQRTMFKMPAHELVCVAMMAGGIFLAAMSNSVFFDPARIGVVALTAQNKNASQRAR